MILSDVQAFKDITDFVEGKPKRFAGFNILEFSKNPEYDHTTMEKIAFDAVNANNTFSSFSFQKDQVMKADGRIKMYETKDDPEQRATIVGFDKRFIGLPIRNKGIGSIVAVPAA